jgi:hypothetical protein
VKGGRERIEKSEDIRMDVLSSTIQTYYIWGSCLGERNECTTTYFWDDTGLEGEIGIPEMVDLRMLHCLNIHVDVRGRLMQLASRQQSLVLL